MSCEMNETYITSKDYEVYWTLKQSGFPVLGRMVGRGERQFSSYGGSAPKECKEEIIESCQWGAFEFIDPASQHVTEDTSDGYHTFKELYHHRAVLFAALCRNCPGSAWKSKKHHDGTMYEGMFIVGINTPDGQATYHYDIDPYWDMFDCPVLENAPEWDGHTPDEALTRILALRFPNQQRTEGKYNSHGAVVAGTIGDTEQPRQFNCIPGMTLDEMLKYIPGGATLNMEEKYVESLAWESNGEAMHERWSDDVTPVEAILKLYSRIKAAERE